MQIQKITSQYRNDFSAILECEHCEATQPLDSGYSDWNYYNNVLPAITCQSCGKNRAGDTKVQNPDGQRHVPTS